MARNSEIELLRMTFEEFAKLPHPPSGYLELHHGQVVLMPPRKKLHMAIQEVLHDLLAPILKPKGFMTLEFAFTPAPEFEAWQADLGFVFQDRWSADDNEYFEGVPDLVIEVLSPSNTMDEMLDRQDICLSNGCRSFWMVDPKRQMVMVAEPDRKITVFDSSASISVLSGLGQIPVAAIFPSRPVS